MPYILTTAIKKLDRLDKRIKAVSGGTSASKTVSIIQILIDKAQRRAKRGKPTIISICSESMPHLKRGAIRDFLNVMQDAAYFDPSKWNKTDFIYTFGEGVIIEFFSLDQPHKVRGPRRQILFINEANNIPLETFDQLEVRTEEEIWLDWNPVSEFWFYTEVLNKRDDIDFITLTYKDNEGLSESIIKTIEARKLNLNWWRVYGEGQLGEVEGKIYKGWNIVDAVPHEARLERIGLDFGYSNDPTAIVAVYYYNGGYILDEITYQKGLSNKHIADILANLQNKAVTIADSAEPKSIDEIASYGVSILACEKGPGSVNKGIQFVQAQRISVTKRSTNILKEYRNYLWLTDKEGKMINDPQGFLDHAMSAVRYAIDNLRHDEADDEAFEDETLKFQGGFY